MKIHKNVFAVLLDTFWKKTNAKNVLKAVNVVLAQNLAYSVKKVFTWMIIKLNVLAVLSIVYAVMQLEIHYRFAQVAKKATPLISAILFVWAV